MKRIFKYTLLQRVPYIIRYNGVLLGIVCIELFFLGGKTVQMSGFSGLWLGITIAALVGLPLFLLVRCSNGYAQQLLFTNESYLMLTLPVSSTHILLGRILAGFVEFMVCITFSCLCSLVLIILSAYKLSRSVFLKGGEINDVLYLITQNYKLMFVGLFMFCVGFCFIGSITLVAKAVLRSFAITWRKSILTLCSIFIFAALIFLIGHVEAGVAELIGGHFTITVYGWSYMPGMHKVYNSTVIGVPLISACTALAFSVLFFFLSARLLEDYIEV